MRNYSIQIILLILVFGSCQHFNQEIISYEGEKILVGKIDLQGLSEEPYSTWFNENYQNYEVDEATLEGIDLSDIEIKLFLGTWCSDSQLEVPQFYKILTYLDFDKSHLIMIALDNDPQRDLQSPQHEETGMDIEFVPTFIFFRNGEEIGRIVEYPKESLEMDMVRITGNGA